MSLVNRYHVILLLVALALTGCGTMYSGKPHLANIGELQANEVMLVGRIELVPPLAPEEQELKTLTSDRFQGKVSILLSDQAFPDLNDLPMSAGNHAFMVEMGKEFYTRQPKVGTLLYSGGVILARSAAYAGGYMGRNVTIDHAQLNLPGGLKFSLKPDDRAIYLGTLRYHRDDYNAITKVEIIDDYKRVNKEFAARFGTGIKLRRALPEGNK